MGFPSQLPGIDMMQRGRGEAVVKVIPKHVSLCLRAVKSECLEGFCRGHPCRPEQLSLMIVA
jgi:hypothetical protein